MGYWGPDNKVWGDRPADAIDKALQEVVRAFAEDIGRLPTKGEIRAGLEFSLMGGQSEEPFAADVTFDSPVFTGESASSMEAPLMIDTKPEDLVPGKVRVGMGVTIGAGGDSWAYTIREVSSSGLSFWVTKDDGRRVDSNGAYSESQEYEYTIRPDYDRMTARKVRWHKGNSRYYVVGAKRVVSAGRHQHIDPHR